MGRAAKYLTQEERLAARRAQRAQRDSRPGYVSHFKVSAHSQASLREKEKRQRQNRRAWRRKTGRELLEKDPPEISPAIRNQANIELSSTEHVSLYQQFCEGRDSVELEGECMVDAEDFDAMIGPGPYPTHVTSSPTFAEDWPRLRSALHGMMVFRYLGYCDNILVRCRKYPASLIIGGLTSTYHDLVREYNKTTIAAQQYSVQGDRAGIMVASQHGRWISRMLVYMVEDMLKLKKGPEYLLSTVCDRQWRIRHDQKP